MEWDGMGWNEMEEDAMNFFNDFFCQDFINHKNQLNATANEIINVVVMNKTIN